MYCFLTLTACCVALLSSSVRGTSVLCIIHVSRQCLLAAALPPYNVESYRWRSESVASLSSLGFTEAVGIIHSSTEPSLMSATLVKTGTIPLPNTTPITESALSISTSASDDCTVYIGTSVNVYYFSNMTANTNTECYTGISQQPSALPTEFSTLYLSHLQLAFTLAC